ncbi:MAG: hypothetical protein A2Z16_01030 [Chloroflexi bacterium RBG_16_54_18]|nr:MAG: hypothetical protein A2Z16_01030 [Chloroflexi bacterium RBG_16_54_18]
MIGIVYAFLSVFVQTYTPSIVINPTILLILNFVSGCIVISIAAYMAHFFSVGAQTAEIALERERQRSERLLLNILPATIVKRLEIEKGIIADRFDNATVLFAFIVGFTPLSEQLSPEKLVTTLSNLFAGFDDLTDKYGVEKIKTTGDLYMVAAGVPELRDDHVEAVVDFALDLLDLTKAYRSQEDIKLEIRIGISSGPVVAGIIGKKKFVYDLWGDTVNTASRMKSHGLPLEIQASQSTINLLGNQYVLEDRGAIEIKGKAKLYTYLIKGRRNIVHEK